MTNVAPVHTVTQESNFMCVVSTKTPNSNHWDNCFFSLRHSPTISPEDGIFVSH